MAGLAGAFVYFYVQKDRWVYRVPDYGVGKDSLFKKTSTLWIIGEQLNPKFKNKNSEKLNREKDIAGIRRYLGPKPEEIWIDYRDSRSRVVFSYVLLVIFLVALFTHLAEEIYIVQKKMSDVFISYNHKDQAMADIIRSHLNKKRIKTIVYAENPIPGADIEASIREWFRNTRVTLALVSRNSLLSGWVGKEILVSLTLQDYTDDRKFLACKVDAIEFDAELTNTLRNVLKKDLDEQDAHLLTRAGEKADAQDITFDRTRIINLIDQLPQIIQKLKSSIYTDFSAGINEKDLDRLATEIKSYLRKN